MKLHRARQMCRASDHFSLSVALYQHFILPYDAALRQQRFSSSAPAQTESSPFATSQHTDLSVRFRRTIDRKGQHEHYSPRLKSIHDNILRRAEETAGKVEELLVQTRMAFNAREEYKAVHVQPVSSKISIHEDKYPWCVRGKSQKTPGMIPGMARLDAEIHNFYEYAKPSRAEVFARRSVIEQVRADVRSLLPNHVLETFGSERTGIALATSDIDFRLARGEGTDPDTMKKPPPQEERRQLLNDLHKLHRSVFLKNRNYLLATIRHARYPLLSMQHRASGIDIQIVLANDTSLARDLMQQYMSAYPYIRPVYSVIKTLFDQRGLSDVFRGGFGSYSIFMMIVASLKHCPPDQQTAASALISFMVFWGQKIDLREHGVSIEPVELFDKSEQLVITNKVQSDIASGKQAPLPKYMLCLRDPADETNDLGRKGVCIKHVQVTLSSLVNRLIKVQIRENRRHSLLAPLVGEVYAINLERRTKAETYGRNVMSQARASLAETARTFREEPDSGQGKEEEDVHGFLDADEVKPHALGQSDADEYGDSVTSILGMPSAEEWKQEASEPPNEAKI